MPLFTTSFRPCSPQNFPTQHSAGALLQKPRPDTFSTCQPQAALVGSRHTVPIHPPLNRRLQESWHPARSGLGPGLFGSLALILFPGSTHTPRETGRVWLSVHPSRGMKKKKNQPKNKTKRSLEVERGVSCKERQGSLCRLIAASLFLLSPLSKVPDGHRQGHVAMWAPGGVGKV